MPAIVQVIGPHERSYKGPYINTTSHSNDWSKGLSPFYLGPVWLYATYSAKSVENAWQYCKVYPQHVGPDGKPTKEYFDWAKAGWRDNYAHRYPMGKGAIPLYSYWAGKQLGYIEARKQIYAPLYADAVLKSEAYRRLEELYQTQERLVLWDFDGYDYLKLGKSLTEVMDDPSMKMGHAFVLAMLLTGERPWEQANI
jgi:hypothetical protein